MRDQKQESFLLIHLAIIFVTSFGLGALIQAILYHGFLWQGFLSISSLIFVVNFVLYIAWKRAGAEKTLAWMMVIAFVLRLGYGVFLAWGLSNFGYDIDIQEEGYVFEDAFRRDRNAWTLARSEQPITKAFSDEYEVDQYGGLLALSGLVYRYVSPDEHRPILIVILAAGVMALSVPFLVLGLKRKVSNLASLWAGWIFVFYPEGVLLGASQMREPFIILFFTIMFWCASRLIEESRSIKSLVLLVLSAVSLLLFSFRVALPMFGAILLWIWVEKSGKLPKTWMKILGWVLISSVVVLGIWAMWHWVEAVLHWDTLQTISRSGRVQFQLSQLPAWLHFPFILIYGILQPVLPAAIAAPAPWVWHSLAIFRALGWYLLFPVLAYVLIRVRRLISSDKNKTNLVFVIVVWAWIIIASARAGGDQWDNPRYRTLFLPWMAAAAGWGIAYALQVRDRWLKRIFIIDAIFILFYTQWYLSRYYHLFSRFGLWEMVAVIILLSLGVVIGGWLWDRKHPSNALTDKGPSL